MKSSFFIKLLVICGILSCLLILTGCFGIPTNRTKPPVQSSHGVSKTQAGLINQYKNAVANGNKKEQKGILAAIQITNFVEDTSALRWIMLSGVVIAALGIAVGFEFGPKLGIGVGGFGLSLIALSAIVSALLPYAKMIGIILVIIGVLYLIWRVSAAWIRKKAAQVASDAKTEISKDLFKVSTVVDISGK